MKRPNLTDEIIRVKGMYCGHCEQTIQKALGELEGVITSRADFAEQKVSVCYDPARVSREAIERRIREAGYEPVQAAGENLQLISVLVIILAVYVIARSLGWTRVFNVFPSIEDSFSLGTLFVIGLLTSVHCIAMCGGINLTQSAVSAQNGGDNIRSNLAYNTGRILCYTLVGGLAGSLGQMVTLSPAGRGILSAAAGVIMVIMALRMLGVFRFLRRLPLRLPGTVFQRLSGFAKGRSSFVIGLLNGFMPCGPLQSMQICALTAGSAGRGALSMLLFGLGTVPLMFGLGTVSGRLNRKYARVMLTVSAVLVFVMGIHMAGNGLSMTGTGISLPGREAVRQAVVEGDRQRVSTTVDYGSYEAISVKNHIPVEWIIRVPEGKLNGCNGEILVPDFGLDVKLHEGENLVTFTPEKAGTVGYSCWMGMIHSRITITE